MRRSHTTLLLVLLGLSLPLAAQQLTPGSPGSDTDGEAVVFERLQTRVSFEKDGTNLGRFEARLRVNSPAGVQRAGTVIIPFRRAATVVDVKYVRVLKPDGSSLQTPLTGAIDLPADITREAPTFTDLYLKHINVQALQPGDVLEYAYETREPSLIPGHFWFEYDFGELPVVLDERLEVSLPAGRRTAMKSPHLSPVVTSTRDRVTYVWQRSGAPRDEDAADEARADVQISSFRDWAEVGEAFRTLWRNRTAVTPAIRAKALELTAASSTDESKVKALYGYVATRIRYVAVNMGIGRLRPHTAAEVLANGFGDCKDKHVLLEALLSAVGIEATPALIAPGAVVDPDVPSPSQFTHVITAVGDVRESAVWLDTTLEVAPFGFLAGAERDAHVLAVTRTGPAVLAKTPADAVRPNAWASDVAGRLNDNGEFEATVRDVVTGDIELVLRSLFRSLSKTEWPQIVQQFSLVRTYGGTVSDVVISSPEDTEQHFRVEYRYKVDSFPNWETRSIHPPAVLALPQVPEASTSSRPLSVGPPGDLIVRSRIELPPTFEPRLARGVTADAVVDQEFGRYQVRTAVDGQIVETERRWTTQMSEVAADRVEAYRAFVTEARDVPYGIELRVRSPWAWNDAPSLDWYAGASATATKILRTAAAAGQRRDYQEAIAIVRSLIDDEPDNDAAWQMLASFQISSGERSRGLDTLRRRTSDAVMPSILKYFATRLEQDKKIAEAIGVWTQGYEKHPDDREFPLYLGDALVREGRYAEALEVLRPQEEHQRESARFLVNLGKAHVGSGSTDAGLTALRRAAELDATAHTLHTAASYLLDRGVGLDDAQAFAERAVKAVAADVNRLTLDTIAGDAPQMLQLVDCWNTLGRLLFRQGEHAAAERYLLSAWHLSQTQIHATHLDELYRARQDERSAQRYATFAASVAPPSFLNAQSRLRELDEARRALLDIRTFDLSGSAETTGQAEVLAAVTAAGVVERVRVVKGDPGMASIAAALERVTITWPAPDAVIETIVRRGYVICPSAGARCTAVLVPVSETASNSR